MQAHLDSGATTLCWCWRLTRRDGIVLGFTDHDRDLVFDGTTFEAAAGFSASEIKEAVGLGVDNLDVEGALQSGRLDEAQLASGLFDDARIEIFRVNWNATEPARADAHRHRSARSSAAASASPPRCGGLHTISASRTAGSISSRATPISATRAAASRLASPAYRGHRHGRNRASARASSWQPVSTPTSSGWFTRGLLTFTGGANTGQSIEVKQHVASTAAVTIELWQAPAEPIAVGDTFAVTAGCDKHLATCRDRFGNVVNFRGFPHMPGNDFVTSFARQG